jgi:hypothetical protein
MDRLAYLEWKIADLTDRILNYGRSILPGGTLTAMLLEREAVRDARDEEIEIRSHS